MAPDAVVVAAKLGFADTDEFVAPEIVETAKSVPVVSEIVPPVKTAMAHGLADPDVYAGAEAAVDAAVVETGPAGVGRC